MKTIYRIFLVLALATSVSNVNAQRRRPIDISAFQSDSVDVRQLIKEAKAGDVDAQNKVGVCYYIGKNVPRNYDIAIKWFSQAAESGHVKAIANMGLCYQFGHGVAKDSLMAVKLYKKSIASGNMELLKKREEAVEKNANTFDINLLTDIYLNGCGDSISKNETKAIKYLTMASDNGSVDATVRIAKMYERDKNYAEALPFYKKAADMGDSISAFVYGDYLCSGKGTAVDKTQAAEYFEKAAEKNVPNAMIKLGNLLYNGDGVEKDYGKAMKLFLAAAKKNNPAAMWSIGIMYKNGEGVKANYIMALQWLSLAANHGMKANFEKKLNDANVEVNNGWKGTDFYTFVHAMKCLEGDPADIATAFKEFTALEKKGVDGATALIGRCYASKDWKKASEKKMLAYYKKASAAGDFYADYLLAQYYLAGGSIEKADKEKVVSYYEKSAEAGYAPAACELGNLYYNGGVVNKNVSKAIEYYQKAYDCGYLTKTAAENLAACYQDGIGGLQKDEEMANEISSRASDGDSWTSLLQNVTFE